MVNEFRELARAERIRISQAALWAEWEKVDEIIERRTEALVRATREHYISQAHGGIEGPEDLTLGDSCLADIARRVKLLIKD